MNQSLEFLRYLAVGGLVTVADMTVYQLLTGEPRRMPRIPANVLSVTLGMMLGFSLHFALVFQPREPLIAERMIKYVAVVAVSVYGVQNAVIYLLATLWRAPVQFAQAFARNLSSKWVARATSPFWVATCRPSTKPFNRPVHVQDDFIDRMVGKTAAALAGVIWNFVLFKWFVYA